MRYSVKRPDTAWPCGALLLLLFLMAGCSAPPSVAPLLRLTERALLEESRGLKEDVRRGNEHTRQTLESLEDGFIQDLEQAEQLTADWVREATMVYVAARETVIKYQEAHAIDCNNRADNLLAAAAATRRAIALIERQDQLLDGLTNDGQRRFIEVTRWNSQEVNP